METLPRAGPLSAGQTQPRNLFPAGPRECFLLAVSDFKSSPSHTKFNCFSNFGDVGAACRALRRSLLLTPLLSGSLFIIKPKLLSCSGASAAVPPRASSSVTPASSGSHVCRRPGPGCQNPPSPVRPLLVLPPPSLCILLPSASEVLLPGLSSCFCLNEALPIPSSRWNLSSSDPQGRSWPALYFCPHCT